jgi:hypothetical protein
MVEPQFALVYGFADCQPTVTLPSAEMCSDLSDIDAEWAGPLEVPT